MRRSSCWAIDSATSCASSSGLRTSVTLMCAGTPIISLTSLRSFDVLTALADHARTGGVDRHASGLWPLDQDLADAGLGSFCAACRTLQVGCQVTGELGLVGVPLEFQSLEMPRRIPIG